jgi:hypothetical protein
MKAKIDGLSKNLDKILANSDGLKKNHDKEMADFVRE